MIQHVLFDLDGTLIHFDHDLFAKNYVKLLSKKFSKLTDPDQFGNHILTAIGYMMHNADGVKTNADRFWEYVDAHIPLDHTSISPLIDDFYDKDFHELQKIVTVPSMSTVIQTLLDHQVPISLATNPVFPLAAVKNRLRWAGLENTPFKRITHYENSHYCKPNVAYYKEILRELDVQPEDCLMIGNDVQEDLAAAQLGIKTYLLTDSIINRNNRPINADYVGSVADLNRDILTLIAL